MARIFITGSADGSGQMAASLLIQQGHKVVLHALNKERAKEAMIKTPGAENVLTADLSSLEETKKLADNVNKTGHFDAVIHNAGVYQAPGTWIFRVNTLAPYILTCLIEKPERLIYLSSGMHRSGDPKLKRSAFEQGSVSYSDSKLHDLILAKAVARKWHGVYANAVDPGWVPTKMGGAGAPDDLQKGAETQVWLAVSNDENAKETGCYFHYQQKDRYLHEADNTEVQNTFLVLCEEITEVHFPAE